MTSAPIGVFDSGVGGLSVLREIRARLPHEPLAFVADCRHVPYGDKPPAYIRARSLALGRFLVDEGAKTIVVACNTATAAAFDDVAAAVDVPAVGVIEPAVRAAIRATRNGRVGLVATEATVRSRAYERALTALDPERRIELIPQACPRFVEFVERGDTTSSEVLSAARSYLALLGVAGVDTLILGCTHYPLLRGVIQHVMGPDVLLLSSAEETASTVYHELSRTGSFRSDARAPEHRFESSGSAGRFAELVTRFLRPEAGSMQVEFDRVGGPGRPSAWGAAR